ncbi:NAD-dependent histone deacetylase sir2 [Irineochytrium annulatum]|nr:NAD-dependent histone deacetylase sir2 [Irineochytrium annulatum]
MVLTGAGVSTSCGIPDFRSENGIYSRLTEFDLEDPQVLGMDAVRALFISLKQMFDIEYFQYRPEEIYPKEFTPSASHRFIKLLESKKKLLRNYTQNIDTLENAVGIQRVFQCHGSFATASCVQCKKKYKGEFLQKAIYSKQVQYCNKCEGGLVKPV